MACVTAAGFGAWVQNDKTGTKYMVFNCLILNATNDQDGQKMVQYSSQNEDGEFTQMFVREEKEFYEKFTVISLPEITPEIPRCTRCNEKLWYDRYSSKRYPGPYHFWCLFKTYLGIKVK